jgi:hypothetical protein
MDAALFLIIDGSIALGASTTPISVAASLADAVFSDRGTARAPTLNE